MGELVSVSVARRGAGGLVSASERCNGNEGRAVGSRQLRESHQALVSKLLLHFLENSTSTIRLVVFHEGIDRLGHQHTEGIER